MVYDGAVYRIGELAKIVNISKRTIDYYTNLGLIQANRSETNYRMYPEEVIEDLQFINECKALHLPLEEIKRKLSIRKAENLKDNEVKKQIESISKHMCLLDQELNELLPFIEKLDNHAKKTFVKKLSVQSSSLFQTLQRLTK